MSGEHISRFELRRRARLSRARLSAIAMLVSAMVVVASPGRGAAVQSLATQGVQSEVSSEVSWGSAGGCVQNIQTNDFGSLAPASRSVTLGSFAALPAASASVSASGARVWVGCVTSNVTLESVVAEGKANMRDGGGVVLPGSDVMLGMTNQTGGGPPAGCGISQGQSQAGTCSLPVDGRTVRTLVGEEPAGTTELNWQYQLELPANQPVGSYTGGQVVFTASAGESLVVPPTPVVDAPASTVLPVISPSTPQQGVLETTTNGTWSNSPTSYAYQWQDCNSSGESCANISGATSSSYTPVAGDVGHTLVVRVTATNAGGSATATSAARSVVVPPAPVNSVLPVISPSAPQQGVVESRTDGAWLNSPTSFAYQWERCSALGTSCLGISGASSASYVPVESDVGGALRVQVTAVNAGGSASATSEASEVVMAATETESVDSGRSLNAVSCVPATTDCVVSDSKGNAFYSTNVSTTGAASWKAWAGPSANPSEAIYCATSSLCLLAEGNDVGQNGRVGGNPYVATSLGGSWKQLFSPTFGVDAFACLSSSLCVAAQNGGGSFRYSSNPAASGWSTASQGNAAMDAVFCMASSFCAMADGGGSVHVASSVKQIESGGWTVSAVDSPNALNGIGCTSPNSCVAVDGVGNVVDVAVAGNGSATGSKQDIDGTNKLDAVTCTGTSICVAVDDVGNVFTSANSGATWRKEYAFGTNLTGVSCASGSLCVASNTAGEVSVFAG